MSALVTVHDLGDTELLGAVIGALLGSHDHLVVEADGSGVVVRCVDEATVEPAPAPADEPAPAPQAPAQREPSQPRQAVKPPPAGKRQHDQAVLDTLAVNQPMAMRELARAAGVPAGSIHYVVHRLEDAGRVACVDGRWTLPKPAATPSKADPQPERPSSNGGVAAGPMRRDGFDPEAARLRAAEGI